MNIAVGHSPQTRLFAPAATFARPQLQNYCLRKRLGIHSNGHDK